MLFVVAIVPLQYLVCVLLYLPVLCACAGNELREAGRRRLQPLLCAAGLWARPPSLPPALPLEKGTLQDAGSVTRGYLQSFPILCNSFL